MAKQKGKGSGFKTGVLLGLAVGGALVLLLAPKPGRETRQRIKAKLGDLPGGASEFQTTASEALTDLGTVVKNFLDAKQREVKQAFETGKVASEQTRAVLESQYLERSGGVPPPMPPPAPPMPDVPTPA